ncbi:DUF2782 domain-containing protein [Dyella sp. 2HG41-7]|uniref:DUF2782 domain-containing protein n=1 Tax=Dyella sp. 2HG41-7 TaxID=2883239 RepID=UPI001F46F08B|nr:DUF2782 domain-containing protein [Dyella sp. 2HG41-7]
MKYAAGLLTLSLLAATSAFAQSSSSQPQFAPAPPPPGMNDPGVNPAKEPAAAASTNKPVSSPAELEPSHLPGKPIPVPKVAGVPASEHDANGQPPPDVSVRQQGENTIQEFRQNGRVYMVVVTPKHGPQQVYNVDENGNFFDPVSRTRVKPVQYNILKWGGSKPASSSSSEDSGQ